MSAAKVTISLEPHLKVTISLEPHLLKQIDLLVKDRIFASRSQAVQSAVAEQVSRLWRVRLARELAKLDPAQEKAQAEEWYAAEATDWPPY